MSFSCSRRSTYENPKNIGEFKILYFSISYHTQTWNEKFHMWTSFIKWDHVTFLYFLRFPSHLSALPHMCYKREKHMRGRIINKRSKTVGSSIGQYHDSLIVKWVIIWFPIRARPYLMDHKNSMSQGQVWFQDIV